MVGVMSTASAGGVAEEAGAVAVATVMAAVNEDEEDFLLSPPALHCTFGDELRSRPSWSSRKRSMKSVRPGWSVYFFFSRRDLFAKISCRSDFFHR